MEVEDLRVNLLGLKSRLRGIQFINALLRSRSLLAKDDPDQTRIPAGQPGGGRWTSDSANDVDEIIARAGQLRLAASPSGYQKCLDLCYRLLERPQTAGSDRNLWDFHKCMNACLARGF